MKAKNNNTTYIYFSLQSTKRTRSI